MSGAKRSLLESSLLLSACSLGASLLGMVSQMIQAHRFGAKPEMGAYFAAVSVTGIIMGMAPAVFSSAVVPALVELDANPEARRQAAGALLRAVAIGAVFISIAGLSASQWIVRGLMHHAAPETEDLAVRVSRVLWVAVGLSILASYLTAVHQAAKRFLQVGTVPLLPPAAVILSVLAGSRSIGVMSVALGLLAGAVLQVALLVPHSDCRLARQPSDYIAGAARDRTPVLAAFLKTAPWVLLSLLPFTSAPLIAVYWAERTDPSALPYFGYCQSIATMLSVTVSAGLATASFPDLVRALAQGESRRFLNEGRRYLKFLFIGAAFLATLAGVARVPILTLLLRRGQFDARAVEATAQVLPWYLAGVVCIACLNFLRNIYYAAGRRAALALIGISAPVVFFVSSAAFSHTRGIDGIALSYAGGFLVYAALALAALRLSAGVFLTAKLSFTFACCGAICLTAVWLSGLVDSGLEGMAFWPRSALTALTAFAALLIPAPLLFSREERRALGSSPLLRRLPQLGGACSKTS